MEREREPLKRMRVTPGAVGPIRADISVDQARASGCFRYREQGTCDGPALLRSKPSSWATGSGVTPPARGPASGSARPTPGDDWIGFAFDVPTAKPTEGSRVTSVEVSHGARPGLHPDGC